MKYEYWLVNGVIYDKFFEVEKLDVLYGNYLFITNEDAGTHIPTYKFPDGDMLKKTDINKIAKLIQRAIDNNTKLKAEDISEIVTDYPDDVLI